MSFVPIPSKGVLKLVVFYACVTASYGLLPILWVVSFVTRFVVSLMVGRNPEYGKLLSFFDAELYEDFISGPPKATLTTTITLEGNQVPTLTEFYELFKKNVLDAMLASGGGTVVRYPEFKQFVTSFWGFRIWKNEREFRMEKHISEEYVDGELSLSEIHQKLMNKPFRKWRSPWEIIMFRSGGQLNPSDHGVSSTTSGGKYVVVGIRIHHCMADAKSIMKVFVECLGQKKLKIAEPSKINQTFLEKILRMPLNYLQLFGKILHYAIKSHGHPWKTLTLEGHDPTQDSVPLVVRLSPKLSLSDVKQVAKKNGVLPSSVIVSIIGGAIGKYDLRGDEICLGFPQAKDNHPSYLANHVYMGPLKIPTSGGALSRLVQCHHLLLEFKRNETAKCAELLSFLFGNLFDCWRRIIGVNYFFPGGITNIAGEMEGFSVGKGNCTEFTMAVGPLPGVAGVAFLVMSYKNHFRVAVTGKMSVLSEKRARLLGEEIGKQLDSLVEEINKITQDGVRIE